jgi:hypothetical protein
LHQRAAARRRGGAAIAAPHPAEIHEGGNQEPLGPTGTRQLGHQRDLHAALALGAGDQLAEIVTGVADIGVGQQEVIDRVAAGPGLALGMADALLQRPQLARPARRQLGPGENVEASRACNRLGNGGRAIAAAVVDQHDAERTRIVLGEQAADRSRDHVGLVARRNDGDHGRPAVGRCDHIVVALARQPEAAAREEHVEPHRERQQPDSGRPDHVR